MYQHRIWQRLSHGRALAAVGHVAAARASLEQAVALAAERRVLLLEAFAVEALVLLGGDEEAAGAEDRQRLDSILRSMNGSHEQLLRPGSLRLRGPGVRPCIEGCHWAVFSAQRESCSQKRPVDSTLSTARGTCHTRRVHNIYDSCRPRSRMFCTRDGKEHPTVDLSAFLGDAE